MQLTDLLPAEAWAQLERDILEQFDFNAGVSDAKGARITGQDLYCNELCSAIKKDANGRGAICAVASQEFIRRSDEERAPFSDECDAGFVKVCVPIVVDGELVGTAGGCGRLAEDGEVDTFLVDMSTALSEDEAARLAASVKPVTQERIGEMERWISARIEQMLAGRN